MSVQLPMTLFVEIAVPLKVVFCFGLGSPDALLEGFASVKEASQVAITGLRRVLVPKVGERGYDDGIQLAPGALREGAGRCRWQSSSGLLQRTLGPFGLG